MFTNEMQLVTAGRRYIRLYPLKTAEKESRVGHKKGVTDVVFHPLGSWMASISLDGSVRVWGPESSSAASNVLALPSSGQSLAMSPKGNVLAASDYDTGSVLFYETRNWRNIKVLSTNIGPKLWSVAFSPDGHCFAAGGNNGVCIWNTRTTEGLSLSNPTRLTTQRVHHLRFSPDSRNLAWLHYGTTASDRTVHLWDISASIQQPVAASGFWGNGKGGLEFLRESPDPRFIYFDQKRHACVYDAANVRISASYRTTRDADPSTGAHFGLSPNGQYLAVNAASGRNVELWEAETGQFVVSLPEGEGTIWCCRWNHDGTQLAVGRSNGELAVWNLEQLRSQLADVNLDWQN